MKDSALGGGLGFSYNCLHLANVLLLDFCSVCCIFLLARKGVTYTDTNLYGGGFFGGKQAGWWGGQACTQEGRDGAARDRRTSSTPPLLFSSFPALGNQLPLALPHSPTWQKMVPLSPPEKSQATTEGLVTRVSSILFLSPAWSW